MTQKTNPALAARRQGKHKRKNRHLVVIDNAPIRRKAVSECRRVIKRYNALLSRIERFETVEKPRFTQWFNESFGATCTRIRELKAENAKLEELVKLVNLIKYSRNTSYSEAYGIAVDIRNGTSTCDFVDTATDTRMFFEENEQGTGYWYVPSDEQADAIDDESFGQDGEDDESEPIDEESFLRELFVETLRDIPGHEDIFADPLRFDAMFAEFCRSFDANQHRQHHSNEHDDESGHDSRTVKALYRSLAQQLHPDRGDEFDTAKAEIWYRVQEAYRHGDLDELEMLKAHMQVTDGRFPADCPVSHIREVCADHRSKIRRLTAQLKTCRADYAWNFTTNTEAQLASLARACADELGRLLRSEAEHNDRLALLVDKWSRVPPEQRTSRKRRMNAVVDPAQPELPLAFD